MGSEFIKREMKRTTTKLFNAARCGQRELVESLVNAGASLDLKDEDGQSPLDIAAAKGHYEIAIYLVKAGADCKVANRPNNWTPLYYAARDGHRELVETLVNAGASVDLKDDNGLSPLYFAARNRHYKIAIDLVKAGADCNIVNRDNRTPLYYAARYGHRELVETLVNAGAIVDLKDDNGLSPLEFAASNEYYEIAIYLVKAGADCNIVGFRKWTPLHFAARDGHRELVEILVKGGAAVDVENDDGETPFWLAPNKSIDLLSFLVKNGAKPYKIFSHELYFKNLKLEKNMIIIKCFLLFNPDSIMPDFSNCKNDDLVRFWSVCTTQVKELKQTFLGSSSKTLFQFLMENNVNKLVNYLSGDWGTEDIEEVLATNKVSVYNEMIRNQFLKGQERKLLFQSVECLISKCSLKILPYEVRHLIYSYMSNNDLLNLKEYLASLEASVNCNVNQRGLKRKSVFCDFDS